MKVAWWPVSGWTLQRQLLLVGALTTLLAWIGGVALALAAARVALDQRHDRELTELAYLLHGISGHELAEVGAAATIVDDVARVRADEHGEVGSDYRYQIWSADGRLLLTNFGDARTPPLAALGRTGHDWRDIAGERWRVYGHVSKALGQQVQVAERAVLRELPLASLDRTWLMLIVPSLALALVPAWALSRWLMRPLRELTHDLARRTPSDLQPLPARPTPADIEPVVSALNALFARVADERCREAAFTAMAAHELRTPLATLRVLAETAQRASDGAERTEAARALVQSVDRCAHLQDQLLTLARLESRGAIDMSEHVDTAELVVSVVAELLPQARARQVRLVSRLDGSALGAHRFGVLTLLRNLVGNAARYAPEGGRVEIATSTVGDAVVVTVDDSGPGIPAAERERVFERFQRLPHEQASGAGLGLAIVRAVAQMHGARLVLADSALGGLRVEVIFRGRALPHPPLLDNAAMPDVLRPPRPV